MQWCWAYVAKFARETLNTTYRVVFDTLFICLFAHLFHLALFQKPSCCMVLHFLNVLHKTYKMFYKFFMQIILLVGIDFEPRTVSQNLPPKLVAKISTLTNNCFFGFCNSSIVPYGRITRFYTRLFYPRKTSNRV